MPYEHNEDLFENTKMTFGEHLEELRLALFKAIVALVGGFLVGLFVGPWIIAHVQEPLRSALTQHYAGLSEVRRQAMVKQMRDSGQEVPDWLLAADAAEAPAGMTLDVIYLDVNEVFERLRELDPEAFAGMKPPQAVTGPAGKPARIRLHVGRVREDDERSQTKSLSVQEPFMVYMKAALVSGVVIASPLVFFFIWDFVAAGLFPHEKRYVHIYMPFSLILFVVGAALAFFVVMEYVLNFLFSFNAWLDIDPDPRISEWLGFALILPLGFGISFQLPLVMLFLERIGIFSVRSYLDKWRVAVLVIAIISMLLTPADPYSMILMEIPLTVLYFGGILLCRFMPRRIGYRV